MAPVDLERVLVPRVPPERRPQLTHMRDLISCGSRARLLQAHVEGLSESEGAYGLYLQETHAGMAVVEVETPQGVRYLLVRQTRPTDKSSIECIAGSIGNDPLTMIAEMLEEISQEGSDLSNLEITEVKAIPGGISHDVARKVTPKGGPLCFFFFLVKAKSATVPEPKTYERGDERTTSVVATREEVRQMVREGRIADLVSTFALLFFGVIEASDIGLTDITEYVR